MEALPDLVKQFLAKAGASGRYLGDQNMVRTPLEVGGENVGARDAMTPQALANQQSFQNDPSTITTDNGMISTDQSNPFLDALNSLPGRPGDGSLLGVLKGLVPNTGTIGGGGPPDHVPGTQQDAALNPTPMAQQPQPALAPTNANTSTEKPQATPSITLPKAQPITSPYFQPTALDPNAIEQLRTSLLTQAGQFDPDNPNSLAARLAGPNSNAEMGQQRNQAMNIEDNIRGFDGERQAKIKQKAK